MRATIVLVSVWMACLPGHAAGTMCPETDHATARDAFVAAERSPPRSRDQWERLRHDLGTYPLFPYVELARLRARWPRVARSELEAFLRRHDGEPVTFRLRRNWLRRLASRSEWSKFIEWYPENASIELQCHHARALLETGDEAGALSEAAGLWMSGESRPKACDPVFAAWLESSRFSPAAAWERTELAMARGGVRLARYLERFLEPGDRRLAAAWREIHKNPRRVRTIRLDGDPSKVETILAHGLERLARFKPDAAVEALAAVEERSGLGAVARAGVERRIGLSFASEHDPRANRMAPERRCRARRQPHAAVARRRGGAPLAVERGHRGHLLDARRGAGAGALAILAGTGAGGDRKIRRGPRGVRGARAGTGLLRFPGRRLVGDDVPVQPSTARNRARGARTCRDDAAHAASAGAVRAGTPGRCPTGVERAHPGARRGGAQGRVLDCGVQRLARTRDSHHRANVASGRPGPEVSGCLPGRRGAGGPPPESCRRQRCTRSSGRRVRSCRMPVLRQVRSD